MSNSIKQAIVIPSVVHDSSKLTESLALFNPDGTPYERLGSIVRLRAISSEEPEDPKLGDLWYNLEDYHFYVYYGTPGEWTLVNLLNQIDISDTEPEFTFPGYLWYDSESGSMYIYYSSAWVEVGTAGPEGPQGPQGPEGPQGPQGEPPALTINQQADDYTLVLTDAGNMVEMSKATASTLTIPANADVAFDVGAEVLLLATGAGQVTVAGANGVTVNGAPGLKLTGQWSGSSLIKRATNTWVVIGDLTA